MSSGPLSDSLSPTALSRSHHPAHTSPSTLSTPTRTSQVVSDTAPFADPFANGVSAYVTACPDRPGTPNIVHVVIHTTVTIPDYARYYNTPISSFQPTYTALSDGSLVSSIYTPHLRISEGWLVMGGALFVLFLRNTYRAVQYTQTVNVKNKTLFYMLVASQMIGIMVSIFLVVAEFSGSFDCTIAGMLRKGGIYVSNTLLVTGILGTKAYRCLSNAGFVIVVLALLRAAIIAIAGVIVVEYRSTRMFTGICGTISESPLLPVSIIMQFLEALFISLCFMWAVYRSYRSPADHARLSLPLDEDDETSSVDSHEKDDYSQMGTTRRGWWDYVPNGDPERPVHTVPSSGRSTPKDMVGRFRRWWSGEPMLPPTVFQRKSSIPGDVPLPQPPRMSTVSNVASVRRSNTRETERPRASSPPPPSVMERIIRYVPRAELLRNMLRNELLYTTFITAFLLVIAVVMLVGVTRELLLGPSSWIILNWVVISMCTMHSFSRVARRHERETWLQDPANWKSMHHAEVEDHQMTLRPRNPRRSWSPVSVASDWRHRQRGDESDTPSVFGRRYRSAEYSIAEPFTPSRPSRVRSTSSPRSPELPVVSRSTSIASSPVASMDFRPPVPRHAACGTPTILPSPDYPPTNASGSPHWEAHSHTTSPRLSLSAITPTTPLHAYTPRRGGGGGSPGAPRSQPSRRTPRMGHPEDPEPPDPDPGSSGPR